MGVVLDRGPCEAGDEGITGTVARLGATMAGIEYHWSTVFAV